MIRKHKSSMGVFFGIYLAVTIFIGGAMLTLYLSNKKAQEKAAMKMQLALAEKEKIEEAEEVASQKKREEEAAKKKAAALAKAKKDEQKAKQAKKDAKEKAPKLVKVEPKKEAKVPTVSELDRELEKMYPVPEIRPLKEIVGNWNAVPRKAYPAFVKIKVPVEFDIKRGGEIIGKGKLPVGSSIIPILLKGDTLLLTNSHNSGISVSLPVTDTNFKEKIKAKYDEFVKRQGADALAKRKAEKERRLGAIAAENAVSEYNDGNDSRFDSVKASIRRGEAGFYQIESAGKWRWSGQEKVDGEDYDIVFVMMVSESAFGVTEKELKALIQGEKVVSWIDVASGEKL